MSKRIISALIMSAVLLCTILFAPATVFRGIVLLIIAGGLYEFFALTMRGAPFYRRWAIAYGVFAAFSFLFFRDILFLIPSLILGFFVLSLAYMRHSTTLEGLTARIGLAVMGMVYLSMTMPFWAFLFTQKHGKIFVVAGIAATAMTDTFAMMAGKLFGRHKFAHLTSPNKTMEGFIAGFFGSVLTMALIGHFLAPKIALAHFVVMGLIVGVVGPFGDLIESMIKRDFRVKDSSNLIPGHGGILDRLDAMIFVAPAIYIYVRYVIF